MNTEERIKRISNDGPETSLEYYGTFWSLTVAGYIINTEHDDCYKAQSETFEAETLEEVLTKAENFFRIV